VTNFGGKLHKGEGKKNPHPKSKAMFLLSNQNYAQKALKDKKSKYKDSTFCSIRGLAAHLQESYQGTDGLLSIHH